jgi:hypothetical protein
VAEIGLDGARVVAVVGELEPAGMPQHVGMYEEREFRSHAGPSNHALISGCGQRRATLRDEDVWGRWGFAQELAQRAAFPRRYRMHAGIPALGPAYMEAPGGEIDVVPAQCHQLRGPETMAVSDQDSRGVAMPRAVLLGGLDEPLDLPVGEIFTGVTDPDGCSSPAPNQRLLFAGSTLALPRIGKGGRGVGYVKGHLEMTMAALLIGCVVAIPIVFFASRPISFSPPRTRPME